jgi:hypothetical protein
VNSASLNANFYACPKVSNRADRLLAISRSDAQCINVSAGPWLCVQLPLMAIQGRQIFWKGDGECAVCKQSPRTSYSLQIVD